MGLWQSHRLEDGEVVTDDDASLVHVTCPLLIVAAVSGVAQTYADILECATLHLVLELGVAFPFLAFARAARDLDMVAIDVTGEEGQAGDTQRFEVIVITQLPGTFLGGGEVVDLGVVDQIRVAAIQVRHGAVTVHALPAGTDLVAPRL